MILFWNEIPLGFSYKRKIYAKHTLSAPMACLPVMGKNKSMGHCERSEAISASLSAGGTVSQ
jgi:hypothetical protein